MLRKAKAGVIDQKLVNLFDKRGIIWAKGCHGLTLDIAEEDAIECGAEEVKILIFRAHYPSIVLGKILFTPVIFSTH